LIGATAALSAAWLTTARHERAEHRKWLREQRRQLYSDALRSLARATVIPIGTSVDDLETWFRELALVREALVTLQVYCAVEHPALSVATKELFSIIEEHDFARIATDAATLGGEGVNRTGLVLMGVAHIRRAIDKTLSVVASSAKIDLRGDITT
jgi:hypothetical protein